MEKKYNSRSPAVKRLMREAAELASPTSEYYAAPLEDNLFEWHFTLRGPEDSEFQEGVYHGRIIVPSDYPMKPPDIIFLTPNGRFSTDQKICLSISGYHPETWQPSWSIRTALLAIIGFMPTAGKDAKGALDYTLQERKILAKRSNNWFCDTCGVKPCTLLLPPSQDSKVSQEEVKDIVQSLQLKGENEADTVKPTDDAEILSTEEEKYASSNGPESANAPSQDIPASRVESTATTSLEVGSSAGNNETDRSSDDSEYASPYVFQAYDVIICIVIILIAALVFRRFAVETGGEIEVEDTTKEDVTDFSE